MKSLLLRMCSIYKWSQSLQSLFPAAAPSDLRFSSSHWTVTKNGRSLSPLPRGWTSSAEQMRDAVLPKFTPPSGDSASLFPSFSRFGRCKGNHMPDELRFSRRRSGPAAPAPSVTAQWCVQQGRPVLPRPGPQGARSQVQRLPRARPHVQRLRLSHGPPLVSWLRRRRLPTRSPSAGGGPPSPLRCRRDLRAGRPRRHRHRCPPGPTASPVRPPAARHRRQRARGPDRCHRQTGVTARFRTSAVLPAPASRLTPAQDSTTLRMRPPPEACTSGTAPRFRQAVVEAVGSFQEVNESVLQTAPHVRGVHEVRSAGRHVARRRGTTTFSPMRLGSTR